MTIEFTHAAALQQIGLIQQLAARLGATFTVAHFHTSKSIKLPVPTIKLGGLTLMLRDNFHDLNLYVKSDRVLTFPLNFFYQQPNDYAWYLGQIERKREYCFRDWTDDEVNDPRILRVLRKNGNGWSEIRGDEKDRWAARASSTAWYSQDWSSGELLTEGPTPFTNETVFYRAGRAYAEGIPAHAKPYSQPCCEFILALDSWEELTRIAVGVAAQ